MTQVLVTYDTGVGAAQHLWLHFHARVEENALRWRARGRIDGVDTVSCLQIPEVSHQKVPEEEQPQRLVEGGGQHQGELRTALLPDQPG